MVNYDSWQRSTLALSSSKVRLLKQAQHCLAQVVKLVDTLASGASGFTAVEVQVLSWAPSRSYTLKISNLIYLDSHWY